jgi:FMN reductase
MTPVVLALSGSPSPVSKTGLFADLILSRLAERGMTVEHIRLRDLPAEALLRGEMDTPELRHLADRVAGAHGIVVATPIFKAAYSGLLKAAFDILPQFALAGKAVLPIATGGSPAHVLALDYALRPVLQSMGARHIVQAMFLAEGSVVTRDSAFGLDAAATQTLDCALRDFTAAVRVDEAALILGHPKLLAVDPAA